MREKYLKYESLIRYKRISKFQARKTFIKDGGLREEGLGKEYLRAECLKSIKFKEKNYSVQEKI